MDQLNWQTVAQWLQHWTPWILGALVVLLLNFFVAKLVSAWIARPIRSRIDETLGRFVGRLVFYGWLACAILGIAGSFGVNVNTFAAIIGSAGLAIGLAFQGTLSNVAAGLMILFFRPFRVGDVVVVGGNTGRVEEIDLFNTTLDTLDNRRIVVPNHSITAATIENMTHHRYRRVEVPVGVAYSSSIEATRAALQSAVESLADLGCPAGDQPSQVLLVGLGASSVDWQVRVWTETSHIPQVRDQLIMQIKKHLDRSGIAIPFPQLDVHLSRVSVEPSTAVSGNPSAGTVQGPALPSEVEVLYKPRLRRGRAA
ncbi:MAG: mechanosensitive ion channel family protein [Pirellulaceae bacterium]